MHRARLEALVDAYFEYAGQRLNEDAETVLGLARELLDRPELEPAERQAPGA